MHCAPGGWECRGIDRTDGRWASHHKPCVGACANEAGEATRRETNHLIAHADGVDVTGPVPMALMRGCAPSHQRRTITAWRFKGSRILPEHKEDIAEIEAHRTHLRKGTQEGEFDNWPP